jgi:hypothetical protein
MTEAILDLASHYFYGQKFFLIRSGVLFFIYNSRTSLSEEALPFLLDTASVSQVDRALVKILTWHTIPVSVKSLRTFPEILDFLRPPSLQKAEELFSSSSFKKILVVPTLPATKSLREESIQALQYAGLDGIILLPEIIEDTIRAIDPRKSYPVITCELLRILKHYKLAGRVSVEEKEKSTSQLELPLV